MDETIFQHENPKEEKFLRTKTKKFSFSAKGDPICDGVTFSRGDFSKLILTMRKVMKRANGIGLSANQIGLPYRMFIGQIPAGRGGENKLYTVLNPELEKDNSEKASQEEGCLSVIGIYGAVERPTRVTLRGFDRYGKPLKIKAWGLLARMFQHEVDHLDGMLFIDKAKDVYEAGAGGEEEDLLDEEGEAMEAPKPKKGSKK
jgi:peptide deformylase